jgi:ATP/maltotriose-dependent transcriptional regulator MalT
VAGFVRHEHARARALLEESLALCQDLDNHWYRAWSRLVLGDVVAVQGEFVQAKAQYEAAIALTALADFLYSSQQDVGTARAMSEEALLLTRELGSQQESQPLTVLVEIALSQGDLAAARQLAEELLALERATGGTWNAGNALSLLARVEARLGNYERARDRYDELLPLAREIGDDAFTASILEGLAAVVEAQGEGVWAARLWGTAQSLRERCGVPLWPAALLDYEPAVAAARLRLGEQAFEAAWVQGRAMTLEQVLGAPGRAAALPAISAEQPARTSVKSSLGFPAGLTAREVEVLRLVAQGLTDAQIAERLVISPRTVNTHLTSIYHKLGVDSRTAATRVAIEQRLV